MAIHLLVTAPNKQNYIHKTDEKSVRIGRSLKCEFNIPCDDLSREHCLFEEREGKYFVTDLGSKNGIIIDGSRIEANSPVVVTEESKIILSNVYHLKINGFAVKTRADIVLEKINPDIQTKTFQLEFPVEKKVIVPKKVSRVLALQKKEVEVESGKKNETLKMIMAFVAILSFILYQALGR